MSTSKLGLPTRSFVFLARLLPTVRPPLHPRHHITPPASPQLRHHHQASPLLRTALNNIFDSDSDCASVRKKEGTQWVGPAPIARYMHSATGRT
jgi:hypothetical protein